MKALCRHGAPMDDGCRECELAHERLLNIIRQLSADQQDCAP